VFTPVPACNLAPTRVALPAERGSEHVMNPKEQFTMPSAMPPSGRRRKPALTSLSGSVLKRLEATFTGVVGPERRSGRPHPRPILSICSDRRSALGMSLSLPDAPA